MYFNIFFSKKNCPIFVVENSLFEHLPKEISLTHTWEYNELLKNKNIEYAQFYSLCSFDNAVPQDLRKEYSSIKSHFKSFYRSAKIAHIDISKCCIRDLVTDKFLLRYSDFKNLISSLCFKNYERPSYYDFLTEMSQLLAKIKNRKINIDRRFLYNENIDKNYNNFIDYNLFGTKTGRLTTNKHSFPILTLEKKIRKAIKPINKHFLSIDYNAAEARMFLALNNKKQPEEDLHDWIRQGSTLSRDESKKNFFAWFYSGKEEPFNGRKEVQDIFSYWNLLNEFYENDEVTTLYGRKIKCERNKALNLLIQSSTDDMIKRRILALNQYLEQNKMKSFISFMIHDNVVVDLDESELNKIQDMKNILSSTPFGNFRIKTEIGENFGELEQI